LSRWPHFDDGFHVILGALLLLLLLGPGLSAVVALLRWLGWAL
jgi:hypothetical protein